MATYSIQIEGGASFECPDDTYILDAAEESTRATPCSV